MVGTVVLNIANSTGQNSKRKGVHSGQACTRYTRHGCAPAGSWGVRVAACVHPSRWSALGLGDCFVGLMDYPDYEGQMKYPTKDEVLKASHAQLARWHRFLPSPGTSGLDLPRNRFEEVLMQEQEIQKIIEEEFEFHGGMTPTISKQIGW